jgi:hypothetical protein
MKKTAAAVLAALSLAALLGGNAHASTFAVTIATPHFGLRLGAPVYAPPAFVAAPIVVPAPVYVAPVRVIAVPRVVAVPPPVYPVVYPYALAPGGKHRRHAHRVHYRKAGPVAAYPYGRY